jgi:hypothetical protein
MEVNQLEVEKNLNMPNHITLAKKK